MPHLLRFVLCLTLVFLTSLACAEPLRVACVGDSITYGSGVADREQNAYPQRLDRLLGEEYRVRNFGHSGATLLKQGDKPYWKLPEFTAATEFQPHIVVIKLGTNDTKPQNWKHADEFAADLQAMIEHFQRLATKPKIYLCRPVPVFETRWGINERDLTEGVIPKVDAVARQTGAEVIDLYAALKDRPEFFPDKIHPNAAGAEVMAQSVYAAITDK